MEGRSTCASCGQSVDRYAWFCPYCAAPQRAPERQPGEPRPAHFQADDFDAFADDDDDDESTAPQDGIDATAAEHSPWDSDRHDSDALLLTWDGDAFGAETCAIIRRTKAASAEL